MFELLKKLFGMDNSNMHSPIHTRQTPLGPTPSSLRAELANEELDRPIVFDPALKQYPAAHRAGEPSFTSYDDESFWYACRMAVIHHVLLSVSRSPWHEHLLLRGSVLMVSWFGDQARRPGDLDWVVVPETWGYRDKQSEQMWARLFEEIEGATIRDDLVIPSHSRTMEEIWTYERAPGIRFIVPWQHRNSRHNGTVQLDFVFQEKVPSLPEITTVSFGTLDPISLRTASPAQSVAWKLLWLATDSYPMGKDLYDAVLLAERFGVSSEVVRATLEAVDSGYDQFGVQLSEETVMGWTIGWDDFVTEYPMIGGTETEWKRRLAQSIRSLFSKSFPSNGL